MQQLGDLQTFGDNIKPITKKFTPFITGNQYSSLASFIKDRYEFSSGAKIDREKFTFIQSNDLNRDMNAIAIYTDYKSYSIAIHLYVNKCITKRMIRKFLEYPFRELNVNNLFAYIKSDHKTMLSIARRLGFKNHSIVKEYYGDSPDGDVAILCAKEKDIEHWLK